MREAIIKFGNFLHKHEESTKTYNTYITAIENIGFIVSSLLAVLNKAIEISKKEPSNIGLFKSKPFSICKNNKFNR